MPVGMGAEPAAGCMDSGMPSGNEARQDSAFPCLFRSLDLFSQNAPRSLPAHDLFQHGYFVTALSLSPPEQFDVAARFSAAARNLSDKISPHRFSSVLTL